MIWAADSGMPAAGPGGRGGPDEGRFWNNPQPSQDRVCRAQRKGGPCSAEGVRFAGWVPLEPCARGKARF